MVRRTSKSYGVPYTRGKKCDKNEDLPRGVRLLGVEEGNYPKLNQKFRTESVQEKGFQKTVRETISCSTERRQKTSFKWSLV